MESEPLLHQQKETGTPSRCLSLFLRLRRDRPTLKICDFQNMGIAARGIICTDYAFCDVCTYHLLARQDTDSVGMRNIAPPLSLRLGHRTALVLLTPFTTVLPLRYRVGSLVMRSKFPCESLEYRKLYSFFQNDIFYETCCSNFFFVVI